MTTLEVVYEDDWATATLKALHEANDQAKTLRRRGLTGTRGNEYARLHGVIDALLFELETLT